MPRESKGVIIQTINVFRVICWSKVYLCPFLRELIAKIEARLSCTNDWGMPKIEAKISNVAVTKDTKVLETSPKGTISLPAVSSGPLPISHAPMPNKGAIRIRPGIIPKIPAPNNGPTALATLFVPMAKAT